MNLLITSLSANAKVNLTLHLYSKIWEISLKVARICFSSGRRWPGMLSDLEIYSEHLGHCLIETQVCSGLCCVSPLAEDKHTAVPMSVHLPLGNGSYTSDGTQQ